ncbi:MAG: SRPBCC domain-containing protein [Chloroflexi bacterium]|nr:SRPBCC domain-containing protein [Chloroflexota bacterium]
MYKDVPDALHVAITAPCSVMRARELLTTPEGLTQWLATDATFSTVVGSEFQLTLEDGYPVHGSLQGFDPGYGMAYTFTHEAVRKAFGSTLVRWSWEGLSPDYTLLTLIQTGHGQGDAWQQAYEFHLERWTFYLRNLYSVVSCGKDLRPIASAGA